VGAGPDVDFGHSDQSSLRREDRLRVRGIVGDSCAGIGDQRVESDMRPPRTAGIGMDR
jgi:hypothetical protein